MNFGTIALVLAIILYIIIAIQNLIDKDYSHALIWISYSMANIGFLWWEIEKIYKN